MCTCKERTAKNDDDEDCSCSISVGRRDVWNWFCAIIVLCMLYKCKFLLASVDCSFSAKEHILCHKYPNDFPVFSIIDFPPSSYFIHVILRLF